MPFDDIKKKCQYYAENCANNNDKHTFSYCFGIYLMCDKNNLDQNSKFYCIHNSHENFYF